MTNTIQNTTFYPSPQFMRDIFNDSRSKGRLRLNAYLIEQVFESYGIKSQIIEVDIETDAFLYIAQPLESVDASEIVKHEKDMALALAATGGNVRIQAPIPGKKDVFGVYVPRVNVIGKQAADIRSTGVCKPLSTMRFSVSKFLLRLSSYFFRSVEEVYFRPQHTKYRVLHQYHSVFRKLKNEELIQKLNQEIGNKNPTWERPFVLTALQRLFEKRGIDYSAIAGIPGGLSVYKPVRLEGKKIVSSASIR